MIAAARPSAISAENFHYVRHLLQHEAAIVIENGKEYLVETRLASVAQRHRFVDVNALIDALRQHAPGPRHLHYETVDALTTNETYFFRDLDPFDALREHVIPRFQARHPGAPLMMWSAASSTGQEAYSLAMLMAEHFPDLPSRILGTDLSRTVIARAQAGVYNQIEVNRGLPARLLVRYFQLQEGAWRIGNSIRARVDFREMNLAGTWPELPRMDIVFLRNVMIYFDLGTRQRILQQVKRVLAPGGLLVLGGAETTMTIDPAFHPVTFGKATFYHL